MCLTYGQRRALRKLKRAIRVPDPRLAARLDMFGRLNLDQACRNRAVGHPGGDRRESSRWRFPQLTEPDRWGRPALDDCVACIESEARQAVEYGGTRERGRPPPGVAARPPGSQMRDSCSPGTVYLTPSDLVIPEPLGQPGGRGPADQECRVMARPRGRRVS
jgi:hypothetical protein